MLKYFERDIYGFNNELHVHQSQVTYSFQLKYILSSFEEVLCNYARRFKQAVVTFRYEQSKNRKIDIQILIDNKVKVLIHHSQWVFESIDQILTVGKLTPDHILGHNNK